MSGVLDAFSAGVLIYTGLVEVRLSSFAFLLFCLFCRRLFVLVFVFIFVGFVDLRYSRN